MDRPVLVLQHRNEDNLGYLKTWLDTNRIDYVLYNAEIDGGFPASIDGYSALAVMGGAMSANDPIETNRQAEILILQSMYRDKPVIGHCLGGQLMAKALGAKITKSPAPEIGWQSIEWVDGNLTREWFGKVRTSAVMHWHYETFSLPQGATLLGSTAACPNQAFAIGKHLAMQFHIEIDAGKVSAWISDGDPDWDAACTEYTTAHSAEKISNDSPVYIADHQVTADRVYHKWLSTTGWFYN